jgi:hypothetical protein
MRRSFRWRWRQVGESAGTGCGVEQSLVVGHKKVRLRRMSRAVPGGSRRETGLSLAERSGR